MLDETKDKPPPLGAMRVMADDEVGRGIAGGVQSSEYLGYLEYSQWVRVFYYLELGADIFIRITVDPRDEPITELTRLSSADIEFLHPFIPYSIPRGPWPPPTVEKKVEYPKDEK